MIRNVYTRLVIILVILAVALWMDLNNNLTIYNPFNNNLLVDRSVAPRLGLDLQGGLQVLLEADVPATTPVDSESMQIARTIMENRTNALGVSENVLQVAGERRIVGEFPGLENTDQVLATIQQTGLLEFVDTGDVNFPAGAAIQTDFAKGSETVSPAATETTAATETETPASAETFWAKNTMRPSRKPPKPWNAIAPSKTLSPFWVRASCLNRKKLPSSAPKKSPLSPPATRLVSSAAPPSCSSRTGPRR